MVIIIIDIQNMIGQTVNSIGRVADMCWLNMGDLVETETIMGKRTAGEFALHLQCPWRITLGKNIIICSSDIYLPTSDQDSDAWDFDWSNFQWDIQGNNLFDEKAAQMFPNNSHISICHVNMNQYGDLTLLFTNKMRLECFVNDSTHTESWRFFKLGDSNEKHLVWMGTGMELQ